MDRRPLVGGSCRTNASAQEAAGRDNIHQQTSFTAGTVANNDELPANLGHDVCSEVVD